MRTLRFLLKKEFLQIVRDRVMLRLIIAVPIVQLVVLSNAATFEVKRARMYLVDLDRTELSRGLVTRLTSSGRFVPRGAPVQLVLNAEDGAAAGVTQSYASQIITTYAAELGVEVAPSLTTAEATSERAPRRGVPNLEVRARGWYNADLN